MILMCVRKMQQTTSSDEFVLQDFYKAFFEGYLGGLHPEAGMSSPKFASNYRFCVITEFWSS